MKMKTKTILVAASLFMAFLISSCFEHNTLNSDKQPVKSEYGSPLTLLLESTLKNASDTFPLTFHGNELYTSNLIIKFYAQNHNLPVWISGMEPNQLSNELISLLGNAQYYGLDTSFYQFNTLQAQYASLMDKSDPDFLKKAVEFELLLTHNCFKLMSHLHFGILYADTVVYGQNYVKYPSNFPDKLTQFISKNNLKEGILDMQPKSYEYRRLQKGLENFLITYKQSDDSFAIPDPTVDSALAYEKAREILVAYNYLNPSNNAENWPDQLFENYKISGPNAGEMFTELPSYKAEDNDFIVALKKFQVDHGLSPDGKIGVNTMKSLQQNNFQRFQQIAVNLERLRWEKTRPSRYVYVNIPSYKLRVIDSFNIVKTFNVVVGTPWTQTPMLNSKIEYFTTNPEWYVPYSISSKELLPKVKADSTYLKRHNYRIYDKDRMPVNQVDWSSVETNNFNYFLQQSAGPGNAMGKIKFFFQNPYTVFIHDTNEKSKFSKDIRAYSHGCMRLQNPGDFAIELLKLEGNSKSDSINMWLSGNVRKVVSFTPSVPLFVRYVTCEGDGKGQITFYQDIYNKDQQLINELFAKRDF